MLATIAMAAPASLFATSADAQAVRLPIAEGVWVKVETGCGAATNVFAHGGGRFGSLYFYGPNQSTGPANETEILTRTGKGRNGFTVVNEGPVEVATRPKGQAVVRAVNGSGGVEWSETVRLCPPALLPAKMRASIVRLGLSAATVRKP
jgi:hypothetical protein